MTELIYEVIERITVNGRAVRVLRSSDGDERLLLPFELKDCVEFTTENPETSYASFGGNGAP